MPDLDVVNGVVPGWHSPYNLVLGGAEPTDVARAAVKALARSQRCMHDRSGKWAS